MIINTHFARRRRCQVQRCWPGQLGEDRLRNDAGVLIHELERPHESPSLRLLSPELNHLRQGPRQIEVVATEEGDEVSRGTGEAPIDGIALTAIGTALPEVNPW